MSQRGEAEDHQILLLALALVVAAVRAGYILYQRHKDLSGGAWKVEQAKKSRLASNAVTTTSRRRKLYPYDLKRRRRC